MLSNSNTTTPMQIDITNIIETARADKEAKVKADQRLEAIREEIEKLQKEYQDICNHIERGGFYLPRWQSDLLAMVAELIEQPTNNQ